MLPTNHMEPSVKPETAFHYFCGLSGHGTIGDSSSRHKNTNYISGNDWTKIYSQTRVTKLTTIPVHEPASTNYLKVIKLKTLLKATAVLLHYDIGPWCLFPLSLLPPLPSLCQFSFLLLPLSFVPLRLPFILSLYISLSFLLLFHCP